MAYLGIWIEKMESNPTIGEGADIRRNARITQKEGCNMRTMGKMIILFLFVLFFVHQASAQEDAVGCKDHPMFTRMPNFYLSDCKVKDFDQAEFVDEKGNDIKVEGKLHWAAYEIKEGYQEPSELQIMRNFENAIKKIGGAILNESGGVAYLKLSKAGKTYWVIVWPHGNGKYYELTVVEKAEMAQEVVADAKSLMNDIQATGHASVYGIYFDFDKADIKPESEPTIKEIAKLLQQNQNLKLYVVGHTDNVGNIDYNMRLSKARADAVVKELTTKYQISPARLSAYGVASLAPVASNRTEDGRAKNRRVELVEQ
jgi:outer membrane protein OmpA-like peptidoglycan-associated protein